MSIQKKLVIALVAFLAPLAFATTASAQAGVACGATSCGLGGQIRGQIGDGLPLPISIAPGQGGLLAGVDAPFTAITIQNAPATPNGLALVGKGLGQPGQVKPTVMATIMQTAGPGPRKLTLNKGGAGYNLGMQGSIGVFGFNPLVFAVQTNLIFDTPHPGTTVNGGAVPLPNNIQATPALSVNGRPGATIVTYYGGATTGNPPTTPAGTPGTNYGNNIATPQTPMAGDAFGVNGLARFTKTKNQFGGLSTGRTLGTAKVYFPGSPAVVAPCSGVACQFNLSIVVPATTGIAGGTFGALASNMAIPNPTGLYQSASIGFNGTILDIGTPVNLGTVNAPTFVPFTGQDAVSLGMPLTTGMLTLSVTEVAPGAVKEIFVRTGTDRRDINGNGVVALVTGSLSARNISKGNANRTWVTFEIPEPSAIFAASAGLFALFGCHQLVRRRSR